MDRSVVQGVFSFLPVLDQQDSKGKVRQADRFFQNKKQEETEPDIQDSMNRFFLSEFVSPAAIEAGFLLESSDCREPHS